MGKRRVKWWKCLSAAICGFLVLAAASAAGAAAEWTFMVYIGGDNNLSQAALADLEEMRAATSHPNVNVIVQAECSNKHSFSLPAYIPGYGTYRLSVRNGSVEVLDKSLGNLDMANPATLRDFIRWAALTYPARKYALVIWDHGAGWKTAEPFIRLYRGAVEDETAGTFMSLAQLGQAVRDSGIRIQLLDFDACLMAMYEVAYEFIGLVDYLVFAEEVEPGDGNPYTPILNALAANPAMAARDLAGVIVREFVNSYRGSRQSVTKSAVDMSRIPQLHTQLLDLVQSLKAGLPAQLPAIANARNRAQRYAFKANLDLGHLLSLLTGIGGDIGTKAAALRSFLLGSVVASEGHYSSGHTEGGVLTSPNVDASTGLAIFFPSAEILKEGELTQYLGLSCNAAAGSWGGFVKAFLDGAGGSGSAGSLALAPGGFAFGTIWVNDWTLLSDADVDLYVVEPDGGVGAPWMGASTSNGYFSADSADSGWPMEVYGAKDIVVKGSYLVVLNYYDDGWRDDHANVFQLYLDPPAGVNFWAFIRPPYARRLSLAFPAPETWTPAVITGIINGWYSDWWIPGFMTREGEAHSFEEKTAILLRIKALRDARRGKQVAGNLESLYEHFFNRGAADVR